VGAGAGPVDIFDLANIRKRRSRRLP
jgi:hypothetical protein